MTTVSCAVLFFSSHLWFLLWIIEFYTISRCFMRVPPPPQPLFLFSDSDDTFFLPILSQNCIFADTCIDLIPSYTFHLFREFRICIWTFFFIKRDRERERESEICCKQWKLKNSVLAWLNQENENALASSASQTVTNVVEKSTRKIDLAEKRIANQKPKIQRENHNKKYVVIAVYYYLNWRTRKKELSEHVCVCGFFLLEFEINQFTR